MHKARSPLVFFALFVVLAEVGPAASVVFVYYRDTVNLAPQAPELILMEPSGSNVTVALGPARANITVYANRSAQLVYNPNFQSTLDGWYCQPSISLSCYWLPNDKGASGGVAVIGNTNKVVVENESAFILQEITVPDSGIVRASLNVTLKGEWKSSPFYFEVGIWDPQTAAWAWRTSDVPPRKYTVYTWDITPYLQPGKRYIVAIGVNVTRSSRPALYVDSVYLTIETDSYTFSQPILAANVTSNRILYARLELEAATADPSLNASLWLVNSTAGETSHITIVNGAPSTTETGWIAVAPSPEGYYALLVRANVSKTSSTNSVIELTLKYCTLPQGMGACVSYPVILTIDPPATGAPGPHNDNRTRHRGW